MDNLPRNDAELAIDPTPLQDAILELLEEAGIAGSINDKIIELVELGEKQAHEAMIENRDSGY